MRRWRINKYTKKHINIRKNITMSSPFQRAFAAKSPLPNHGKIQKKLDKLNKKYGDTDFYEREDVQNLIKKKTAAKEAHKSDKKTLPIDDKNSYDYDYDQNEDITTAKKAPLKKNYSPLDQGGYVGGGMSRSDYAPTADLYQNMFNKVESATKDFMDGQADVEARAESGEARAMRRDRKFKKKGASMSKKRQARFNEKTDEVIERAADFRELANAKQQRATDAANAINSTKTTTTPTTPSTPPSSNPPKSPQQPAINNAWANLFNTVQNITQNVQQKAVKNFNKAINPNINNQIQEKDS